MSLELKPGKVIGTRSRFGGAHDEHERTADSEALVKLRHHLRLVSSEASERVGVSIEEWLKLERGALVFPDAAGYAECERKLRIGGEGTSGQRNV